MNALLRGEPKVFHGLHNLVSFSKQSTARIAHILSALLQKSNCFMAQLLVY